MLELWPTSLDVTPPPALITNYTSLTPRYAQNHRSDNTFHFRKGIKTSVSTGQPSFIISIFSFTCACILLVTAISHDNLSFTFTNCFRSGSAGFRFYAGWSLSTLAYSARQIIEYSGFYPSWHGFVAVHSNFLQSSPKDHPLSVHARKPSLICCLVRFAFHSPQPKSSTRIQQRLSTAEIPGNSLLAPCNHRIYPFETDFSQCQASQAMLFGCCLFGICAGTSPATGFGPGCRTSLCRYSGLSLVCFRW